MSGRPRERLVVKYPYACVRKTSPPVRRGGFSRRRPLLILSLTEGPGTQGRGRSGHVGGDGVLILSLNSALPRIYREITGIRRLRYGHDLDTITGRLG